MTEQQVNRLNLVTEELNSIDSREDVVEVLRLAGRRFETYTDSEGSACYQFFQTLNAVMVTWDE